MQKTTKRVIALVLAMMLLIGVIPTTAFAAIENWEQNNVVFDGASFGTNGYYNVISKKDYTLVPGAAVESEMVINNAAGTRRNVMHIIEVDPSNPDVSIVPGYYGIDNDLTDVNNWKAAGVTNVVKYYEDNLGYNVVGAMNTSLAYDNNAPIDFMVYNGVNLSQGAHHAQTFLAVIKDPDTGEISCELHKYSDGIPENCWQAVSANFNFTVNDGVLVSKTEERTSATAARSMIGVKEDGTLVLVMNDGRGANNSVGFNNYELGESMLALGCKWAVNCDGGGSSSFVTKRAGEDTTTMRCVPCDGAERPTLNSILITSNVGPTGELGSVNVESDYDYFAPGTSYTFSAEAIDTHGYAMDLPVDAAWSLSDDSFGTIANGTFVSNGTFGDVDVQISSGGAVVGSKTIHIANPTNLSLSSNETVLPYSTADKVRTTTIPVVTKIGEADVYCDGTFNITLSDPSAATLDGFVVTATTDTSKTGVVATLTYNPTGVNLTYTITYGKGSEILWDFEDGIDGWLGQQDAHDWQVAHGVTPFDEDAASGNSLYTAGQMNGGSRSKTFVSTVENGGKVHNGNQALGVEYDFRGSDFNSWVYMILFNVLNENGENPDCVLRDTENGKNATAIGMWLYLPVGFRDEKNAGSLALQMNLFYRKADGSTGQAGVNMQYKGKNINSLTEADIPDGRWIYVKGALPNYPYVALTDPLQSNYRAPSVFRMYIKPSVAQTLTYYYDDITLDYSSAVDDREEPVISNPCYAYTDSAITINNGDTVPYYVDFSANAADFAASNATGIDPTSAAVYLDGVKFNNAGYFNGQIIAEDYPLSEGEHTVIFEISDNLGNIAQLKRTINCTSTNFQGLYLDGHNDSGSAPLAGSMYYLDLKAKNIENIKKIETTIDLQTANTWETEHLEVADGFTATYTVNQAEPEFVTFTIEKTGNVALTGDQTLLTVPVRVWNWDESWPYGGDGSAVQYGKAGRYNKYGEPVLKVAADVVYGKVNYIQNAETTTASFGGSYSVDTVVDGNKTSGLWHTHDAELTTLNKDATCTEDGYTGRTYCETCKSVVDWGTTIPATGHDYQLNTSTKEFVCSHCGGILDISGITGPFEVNGKHYGAINGNLVNGWQNFEDGYYFFNPSTYASQANYSNGKVTFSFEADGKLTSGEWYDDGEGWMYYYGPDYYRCTAGNPYANVVWATIDGDTYGFDKAGHRHEGIRLIIESNNDGELFEFANDGKLIGKYETDVNGLFYTNGQLCYLEDGVPTAAGLVLVDGYYYYFNSSFTAVKGRYNVTRPNGLMPGGEYEFDDNYRMKARHGVFDGKLYVNGVLQKCYQLINFEGDWYFINDGDRVAKSTTLYLSSKFVEGSGLVPGYYEFDADGKIVLREGFQEDGTLWIHGVQQRCYQLLNYEGDWYFISDGHKPAKNARVYLSAQFVEGTDFLVGYYEFDADGKMIIKNGPQDDGFFYQNGTKLSAYQLVEYEGDYYFIDDGNKYAKSKRVYLSQQFVEGTDFTPAYYDFLADGTLDMKNGPLADGYFYRNGVRLNAYQLVQYEGHYYFIDDGNKYAKSKRVYLSQQFLDGTDLVPAYYDFLADGTLDMKEGPMDDGYFYHSGVRLNAYQLVQYEGKYYFIDDGNKYAKSKRIYLSQQFLDGTDLIPAYYDFLADGTLDMKEGPKDDGYFYHNGVRLNAYQLIQYDGDWYFIDDGNKYAKNKRIYLSQQFVDGTDFAVGYYEFDVDGKLVIKNGPWDDGFFYLNSVRQDAYQLIKFDGNYYFISDGNKYAKNQRVYLNANFIGEEPLEVGYYQFGADGSLQGLKYYTNAQGEVVPDLGMIFENGEYYYVRPTGQLAIGTYKINHTKTNGFLKGDKNFNFDENGVMSIPDYYIKSIRDGRDVGVFMAGKGATGINGRALKTGTLLRGAEIDGAIDPLTNQPDAEYVKQYAIDTLTAYGVTLDMDLRYDEQVRLSDMGITDPLGDSVTHTFYDMVLYDNVFTAEGKAKIKNIFDDLAALNGPVYIHCTYGLDRTGIICFLLEGVLGVDEWTTVVEYCTTMGSDQPAIDKVRNGVKQYYGATYTEKVENFLKDCGITDAQIAQIRDNFLEPAN